MTVNAGTQTFNNAVNTFSGATTINGGTLVIGAASGITGTAATVHHGGTLSFTGNSVNTRYGDSTALALNGGVVSLANVAGARIDETIGTLNFGGLSTLKLTRSGADASSWVALRVNSLGRADRGVLLVEYVGAGTLGAGSARGFFSVTNGANAPAVLAGATAANNIVAPYYISLTNASATGSPTPVPAGSATFLNYTTPNAGDNGASGWAGNSFRNAVI